MPRVASGDVPRDRKAWRLSVRVGCFARLCLYGASVREAKKCAAASGVVECAEEEVGEEETVFGVFFFPEWAVFVIHTSMRYCTPATVQITASGQLVRCDTVRLYAE